MIGEEGFVQQKFGAARVSTVNLNQAAEKRNEQEGKQI